MKYTSEQLAADSVRSMRTHALLYYAISKYLVENYGFEGGRAVRLWMRKHSNWRGTEMRKAHTHLGMPIDMEHIQRFWDNALSDFWYRKEGKYTTYDVAMQVPSCGYADVWQEKGWWTWGHVYCDELHQAILKTYNPDGVVVIPECLMKGDSCCDFRWIMPPHSQLKFDDIAPTYPGQDFKEDYLADTPEEAAYKSLRRGVRLFGVEIYMLKQQLMESFPEQADEAYEKILALFAEERAKDLTKAIKMSGIDPLEYVINNFDIPFSVFKPTVTREDNSVIVELNDSPIQEAFNYFDDASELSDFYCKQIEMMSDYKEFPLLMEVKSCMCNENDNCKIIFEQKV